MQKKGDRKIRVQRVQLSGELRARGNKDGKAGRAIARLMAPEGAIAGQKARPTGVRRIPLAAKAVG